jgi:RHS repeat-associated protein
VEYRYGFNNQEQDAEMGDYYAFEYRIHDTRLGRFLSVDPLAPEYPWNSCYAFAENRVIYSFDIEGCEAVPLPVGATMLPVNVTQSTSNTCWMEYSINSTSKSYLMDYAHVNQAVYDRTLVINDPTCRSNQNRPITKAQEDHSGTPIEKTHVMGSTTFSDGGADGLPMAGGAAIINMGLNSATIAGAPPSPTMSGASVRAGVGLSTPRSTIQSGNVNGMLAGSVGAAFGAAAPVQGPINLTSQTVMDQPSCLATQNLDGVNVTGGVMVQNISTAISNYQQVTATIVSININIRGPLITANHRILAGQISSTITSSETSLNSLAPLVNGNPIYTVINAGGGQSPQITFNLNQAVAGLPGSTDADDFDVSITYNTNTQPMTFNTTWTTYSSSNLYPSLNGAVGPVVPFVAAMTPRTNSSGFSLLNTVR